MDYLDSVFQARLPTRARLEKTNVEHQSLILEMTREPTLVTGSVKMIRFSCSNKDTKDEGRRESWPARDNPYTRCYAPSPQLQLVLRSLPL